MLSVNLKRSLCVVAVASLSSLAWAQAGSAGASSARGGVSAGSERVTPGMPGSISEQRRAPGTTRANPAPVTPGATGNMHGSDAIDAQGRRDSVRREQQQREMDQRTRGNEVQPVVPQTAPQPARPGY